HPAGCDRLNAFTRLISSAWRLFAPGFFTLLSDELCPPTKLPQISLPIGLSDIDSRLIGTPLTSLSLRSVAQALNMLAKSMRKCWPTARTLSLLQNGFLTTCYAL